MSASDLLHALITRKTYSCLF